jgi:hypothetical protein
VEQVRAAMQKLTREMSMADVFRILQTERLRGGAIWSINAESTFSPFWIEDQYVLHVYSTFVDRGEVLERVELRLGDHVLAQVPPPWFSRVSSQPQWHVPQLVRSCWSVFPDNAGKADRSGCPANRLLAEVRIEFESGVFGVPLMFD